MNLRPLYNILETNMGPQNWMTIGALWAQSPLQVMWTAILIQNASSTNADAAARDLLAATNNDPAQIRAYSVEDLAEVIKRAGLYRTKASYLIEAAKWVGRHHDDLAEIEQMDRATLQAELLAVKGIGNETADDIMLYGFHKPLFIADTYARRQFGWMGVKVPATYRAFQTLVEMNASLNWDEFQELHALIDGFGKQVKNQQQWVTSFMADFTLPWTDESEG
ncbi:endonuclease III domain-containing protein [Furfurilactobacillus curtus]|uniref:Endonuclease III n=1 Tax=Furfurilactobacillus curtus TaxID=1746200 RepID=A0ABQ5JTD1_9LACO